jgi:hypothetical protein
MARSSVVGIQKTLKAGADLSAEAKQFTFVKASDNQTVVTCGAGEQMLGVQQDLVAAGRACMYRVNGTTKLRCDGSGTPIAAGARLAADANGLGVVAAGPAIVGAIALEGCTVNGGIIEAQLVG